MLICNSCPRKCNIDRTEKIGVCGVPPEYKIARAALHFWEEPCISGDRGSGTIFFSGCSLKCVYCQNYEISRECKGKTVTEERLIEIFRELEGQGAHNINLVNPTHFVPQIAKAFELYRPSIPVVYNTHGYELIPTLEIANTFTDVYLPDMK